MMTIFAPPPMTPCPAPVEWFLVRDTVMEPRNGREGFTLGEIRYGVQDSQRVCYTVEDQHGIQEGRYRLTVHQSSTGHPCISINAVPGARDVEIFADGHKERLDGHVAVGTERLLDGCGNCKPALISLITELRRQTMKGVAVYLNVVSDAP